VLLVPWGGSPPPASRHDESFGSSFVILRSEATKDLPGRLYEEDPSLRSG
jgi:hypothetical protein